MASEKQLANGLTKELIAKPYFHGLIAREDCADLLRREMEFIVRVSEPEKGLQPNVVISVLQDKADKKHAVKHYLIRNADGRFHCERQKFDTIIQLIDSYVKNGTKLDQDGQVYIKHVAKRQRWELRNSEVHLEKKLGEGAYGEVWRGTLDDAAKTKVAVKQTHMANLTKEQIKEVMSEARVMRKNQHPNVVRLIGVAALEEPLLIVMELANNGSLDGYLQKHGQGLTAKRKADMCMDAAYGLRFLRQRNILHRDLAARNCLLNDDTVKLSDFGKSQDGPTFEMQPTEKLPIRWLSPETMRNQRFTFPSEVWSFGIVCWEIFNDGVEPYPGMMVREANVKVLQGFRLGMPPDTPADVRTLVEQGILVDEPLRLDIDVVAERLRQHTGRNEAPLPPPPTFDDDDDIDRAAGSVWDSPSRKSPGNKVIDPSASRGQRSSKKPGKRRHAEKSSKKKDKKKEKKPEEAKPKTK